jgi:hypothetical protein
MKSEGERTIGGSGTWWWSTRNTILLRLVVARVAKLFLKRKIASVTKLLCGCIAVRTSFVDTKGKGGHVGSGPQPAWFVPPLPGQPTPKAQYSRGCRSSAAHAVKRARDTQLSYSSSFLFSACLAAPSQPPPLRSNSAAAAPIAQLYLTEMTVVPKLKHACDVSLCAGAGQNRGYCLSLEGTPLPIAVHV